MIRHIVIMKFSDVCSAAQHEQMLDLLRGLREHVPQVRALSVGTQISAESRTPDVGLVVDVDSLDDLAAYAEHPYHLGIGQFFSGIKASVTAVDVALSS